jgi:hypothetical protein
VSFIPAVWASRSRSSLPILIILAVIAIAAFATGSEAAASSGGVGPAGPAGSPKAEPDSSKYDRIWDEFPSSEKRWARTTSECESGGDPNAIGGGGTYRGAFQFMKSTWKTSPKSPGGDPIDYDYRTQAVVAVLLKRDMGSSPWPVCG